MKRAVFLDRDGVINRVIIKKGRPYSPRKLKDFKITGGIGEVLSALKRAGYLLIVITNQPDLSRGRIERGELDKMHRLIRRNLPVDDIFVCPHDDADRCDCRKPKPGMILEASRKWRIDPGSSFLIGDRWRDMEAGRAAGCRTILLGAHYNKETKCDYRINDISEALKIISP